MKKQLISFSLLFLLSCKETPPGPHGPPSFLSIEDVSCTEVWLSVTITYPSTSVVIVRDGKTISSASPTGTTFEFVDDSLLPNHKYTYQAQLHESVIIETSTPVQVTTMDTTSHDFTLEVDTLAAGNSDLWDVTIINDTLAYAVGQLNFRDSTGNWDPYGNNIARWNGQKWISTRVPFVGSCNGVLYPILHAIWALSPTFILVTDGGAITRYDGSNSRMDCGMNSLLTGAINKIFAAGPEDIYAVGNLGALVHYSNGTWQKIQSGTTTDLTDVWGSPDGGVVWVCGWAFFKPTVLLKCTGSYCVTQYQDTNPFTIREDSLSGELASVWAPDSRHLFVASNSGPYQCSVDTKGAGKRFSYTSGFLPGFPFRLRGNYRNDIWMVGEYNTIAHFNGVTWRYFDQFMSPQGHLNSVAQLGNQVIAVGLLYDPVNRNAIAIRGRR